MASSSNSIIPGSSSSSARITLRRKYYDVFVSFRGKDTRYSFTDHLFASLKRKGIVVFRDDKKLKKGESIAPELRSAIEGSQIFVVVFSKNYASSTWCLRELEHILYCVQVSRKRVLPIFYDVEPSEVRKQSGSYAEAFKKHKISFTPDLKIVQRWREALTQVSNLSGWDLRNKHQNAEIEKIVEEIMKTLDYNFPTLPKDIVGLDSPIGELEKHLLLDSADDVRVLGICGMGGIGKTTIATALYNRISHQFDECCVIDDLSKIYREDGPIGAKKQILCQTLGEEHFQICNPYKAANLIRSRLCHLKSLIILDHVDHVQQLEKLAVNRECLGAGSRVIVISRDEHIMKEYGVDAIYKVPLMSETNFLELFCQKAFKHANIVSSYEQLAHDILSYANGLPLAIKVLGSFLVGRNISEWRSALARLRERPNNDIMDVLRLSFDGLEEMEKDIFLDIACFYDGYLEEYVKNILNCCGFHADVGLRVLKDKSLISISKPGLFSTSTVEIHSLLQELGRKIVEENLSTKELRKWSRLWHLNCLRNAISENMEKNVEAVFLSCETTMIADPLSEMSNLRLLILLSPNVSGTFNCLSNKLRYIEWNNYPFMYLPSCFQPDQLVELYLRHSNIKQLWEGKKNLPNLRALDLSYSKNLIEIIDFGEFPNLEWLNLQECVKLWQVDPSIGLLIKLVFLNLKNCKNLLSIPSSLLDLNSLKYLNLSGCAKVFSGAGASNLVTLPFGESALNSQSLSTSMFLKWIMLPSSLPSFSCLRELDISFCGIGQIPDAIGCLHWLESLNLGGNNFVTLPTLKELSKLVYLNLEHCRQLKSLPELPLPELPLLATTEQYHPEFPYRPQHWKTAGLYIFNCPKLDESESCSIMTFSWMAQLIQATQESSVPTHEIGIVIPGSKIPSWFVYHEAGESISMNPSTVVHDTNFIGVACCVVFSLIPFDPTTTKEGWEDAAIVLGFQRRFGFGGNSTFLPLVLDRDLINVKSSHVCIIYFTRELFFHNLSLIDSTLNDLDDIMMKASFLDGYGLDMEAKNCGYCWVYKQDLQQLKSSAWEHLFLPIKD